MQISIEEPDWYLEQLNRGCILDPSIFYSVEHLYAVSSLVSQVRPKKVLLPTQLYEAIHNRQWLRFLQTLVLWAARYEEIPDIWDKTESLIQELEIKPIPELKQDDITARIYKILELPEIDRPLYRMSFEILSFSVQNSFPIIACKVASYRIIELLKRHFEVVVVEPAGRWKAKKIEKIRSFGGSLLLALKFAGIALIFISVTEPIGYAGASITLTIVVIDG